MIELVNVSKAYGTNQVLKDVNATFLPGSIYGIVGENGAGKTTLFRSISGLERHTGEIRSALNPLKNHIGFLATQAFFFSKITGEEYLRLLTNARGLDFPDMEEKNVFDLPLDKYASNYSTGMKKKLALLGLLFQENEVLILDEPFNGVDIQSNMIIGEILFKLKSLNKTVLISSHIFSTLSTFCDEILYLRDGVFKQRLQKDDFAAFELEMKELSIGNKIDRLNLS